MVATLKLKCPNNICKVKLDSDTILSNSRRAYYKDERTDITRRKLHWECHNCGTEIKPVVKVRVSRSSLRPVEKVPLFHPVQLRNLLELFLQVDENYQALKQRSQKTLREENKRIYWNLVYLFSVNRLPFEFLIPYARKEETIDQTNQFDVKSQFTLMQRVKEEGMAFIDDFVKAKIKKQKQIEARAIAKK